MFAEYIEDYRNYIFHYTKWSVAKNNILKDAQIRLSPFSWLGDPREYKDWRFNVLLSGLDKNYYEKVGSAANKLIRNNYKVLCFTEMPKIEPQVIYDGRYYGDNNFRLLFLMGYAKSRMWSQYSDDHKGICLVFNKRKLLNVIRSRYPIFFNGSIRYKNYSSHFCKARSISIDQCRVRTDDKIKDALMNHIAKNRQALLFEKNKDYRDENEYRIIVFSQEAGYEYIPIKDILCGVIVNHDKYNEYLIFIRLGNCMESPIGRMLIK